jgi:hypothetical protein
LVRPYQLQCEDLPALEFEPAGDSTRVITVRLPARVHAELKLEAELVGTSLNALCVSRLIAAIPCCPILPDGSRSKLMRAAVARTGMLAASGELIDGR